MNDTDQHSAPRSGPDCGSFTDLLPLLGVGTLEAREEDHLRQHLATCAYCQLQQATYNRMDLAMRRYFGASAPLLFSPEDIMSLTDQEPMVEPPLRAPSASFRSPMHRPRRVFTWVAAVAAVMVIALLTTALFISHRPTKSQTANTPSATTGQSSSVTVYGSSDFSDYNDPPSADSTLFALDAASGKVRWTNTSKTTERMLPVVENGVFYIGASDGTVSAYQASYGKLLWTQKLLDNSFVDQVAGGVVIAHSFDNQGEIQGAGGLPSTIFALDASTGHELWRFAKGVIPQAFVGGTVYAAREGDLSIQQEVLYAINARDGSERWEFQSQGNLSVEQVAGGQVFVLAQWVVGNGLDDERAQFYAVDAATGQQHWVYPKNPTTSLNTVGIENGLIFLESNLGAVKSGTGVDELDAVSTSDGTLNWKLPLKQPYDGATDDNSVIYVVMNHTIAAYQASDGQLLTNTPVRDGAYFAAVVNGVYYLYLNTGMIAVDARSGNELWYNTSMGSAVIEPIIVSGLIYTATDHAVVALDASTGKVRWTYDLGHGTAYRLTIK